VSPGYEALLASLRRARRLLIWRALERAGLALTVGLLAAAALALAVALAAPLHRAEYAALRVVIFCVAVLLFALAAYRVARSRAGLSDAALEAGRLAGERGDDLLAALELARGGAESGWTSGSLRDAAIQAAAERAAGLPIERLRRWKARPQWLIASGGALLLLVAVAFLGGARTPVAVKRIANPASAPQAPIRIRVEPGTREIEGGETIALRAYVAGSGSRPKLLTREGKEWRPVAFADADAATGARPGERAYAVVLRNIKDDVTYRVRVADQTTPVYALHVRDLPRATGYRIGYEYPGYTGLKPEESQAITGDLAAPRGTRATLDVSVNRLLADAQILFDRAGASIPGTTGDRIARFTVPMRGDDRFTIRLTDPRGRRVDLGPFDLRAIPDRPPTVTVLAPAPIEDVTRDMTAVILAGATDDYGVRKVLLRYRARQEAERLETLHEERAGSRELAVRYTWALGAHSLLPGEEIEYQVGAVDGDAIDGPQTTWSDWRRLRFPSATEILASMERDRDETIETLEQAWKDASELQKKAEELSREVGRSRELTWEQRQEVQKTLEGQDRIREQIDKAAEKLSQDAEKLAQSRALNAELVQKIEELHKLLSQIRDQSLLRSMERLQEAMKKMSPQEMERALQNTKISQEEILKNLERTIEMLKQIRLEEKLEAASERAAEMVRRQLALNDSLSRSKDQETTRGLSQTEKQIAKMSEEERAALDSLAAELSSLDQQSAEESARLSEQLGPEGAQKQFQRASQSMEQGEQEQAEQQARELARQLEEFRKSVDQMREQFAARKKNEMSKQMEQAAQDLLDTEALQEKMLADESSGLSKRAEIQKGLQEATEGATNRVAQLSKQTLFITPDIAQSLGRALTNQQNAVGRYSQQDLAGGLMGSKEAAISLNQAAAGLLRQRDSMQGARSSTGFQEAMERLQQLGGQQQGLNQQAMDQMGGGEGGDGSSGEGGERLSPGQGDALGRMAAEQEAIRRGLEEAAEQLGRTGGTLGNLNDVSSEMKKVEQDLRSGRLDQQTLDRQQRILSRLLDAPRSVEKRDYSRRRVSRPGVDVVRTSPGALSAEMLKSRPSLAALLARGGRDPIAPRYRATVDEYFQSILEGKAR